MASTPAPPEAAAPPASQRPPPAVFRADGTRFLGSEKLRIETINFHNPTLLAEGELRRLRVVHDEFVRGLTARLSSLLRSEVASNLGRFETVSCEAFIESLKSPSQIALFRVTPLNGVGYIELPPRLAAALTNRILGGREPGVNPDGYLTEIEIALLEDVIAIITSEWCEQWKDPSAMTAHLIGHETNPRFIQATVKNTMMLVVGIEIALGRVVEVVQVAVPLSMIEPMMKRLDDAREREAKSTESTAPWRSGFGDIPIPVNAELIAARMTVAALLELKKGDVLELPASALEETRITVAGCFRFTAQAGQRNGHVAVQIAGKASIAKK